ncbi:hypothetical protein MHC_00805 [Mycoplasma haemocanis str. Illinois]|uniref:Uncharacterized protein n=1 Tax=Mycoplasma haemocanis (strain Illinois) TaxID=1111676 RepID=H6N5R7_MYCHN|nr:hypothetical protein [Mycoplasma haemocanis]AEW45027.1 hypothetical protein MHC_00805 [Mycoplasma haemocanis str. Illinois]
MNFTAKLGIGIASGLGISGAGVAGTHYSSIETIGNQIKDSVLGTTSDFDEAWSDQFKKLAKESKLPNSLESIKNKYKDNNKDGGQAINRWCQATYKNTYKSKLSRPNGKELEMAKKFCILTLSERLTNSLSTNDKILSFDGTGDESDYQTNYSKINNHNNDTEGHLPQELSNLKKHAGEAGSKWKEIQNFCKQKVPTPFRNINDFKIVRKYCTKNSSN